ncbi:YppE family protein [Litchfieldia alkalitelluris]|uniref:YppE family protein n=1 Tax=Litchfieldia alkalitelluris TaxID=304268 RepID=UPI00099643D2|nr:YppE family protein [Litchfieldia alkalitelluris]
MEKKLIDYTTQLIEYCDISYQRLFELIENDQIQYEFFNDVKPFADKVKKVADDWKAEAMDWVGKEKPKYLHTMQIETTYDHLLSLSISCFYRDTKIKRFKDTYQSIHYVLNQIIK